MKYLFISLFCITSAVSLFGTVDDFEAIRKAEDRAWRIALVQMSKDAKAAEDKAKELIFFINELQKKITK
ncbi:MAG: hypothetical protein WCE21_02170 [Candidatus Babeliales bacterium]